MKLRPDEITKVLREQIEQYQGEVDVEEVGTVLQVATVSPASMACRRAWPLRCWTADGVTGLALNLERTTWVVLLARTP